MILFYDFIYSGKSTLLNILSKGGNNEHNVNILVKNAQARKAWKLSPDTLTGFIGHVPQEDILDRALTVRELLTFHAKARRPPTTNAGKDITEIVNNVLCDLSIAHIADAVIGGGENLAANISGGQLKRVNIGCELVAMSRPGILFLDEPTAGLDASISYELIETLDVVRNRGITIVMILQQPRAEIFARINHLFLMNIVGGIVYEGPSSGAVKYLTQSLSFPYNPISSDADYCLDVLNGIYDAHHKDNNNKINGSNLHIHWEEYMKMKNQYERIENASVSQVTTDFEAQQQQESSQYTIIDYQAPSITFTQHITKFLSLFVMNCERWYMIRIRNTSTLWIYFVVNMIMAVALASGFSIILSTSYLKTLNPPILKILQGFFPSALFKYRHNNIMGIGFTQLMFFMSAAIGCGACLTTVPVLSGQEALIKREVSSGMFVSSYILGRMFTDLIFVVMNAFCFAGVW